MSCKNAVITINTINPINEKEGQVTYNENIGYMTLGGDMRNINFL